MVSYRFVMIQNLLDLGHVLLGLIAPIIFVCQISETSESVSIPKQWYTETHRRFRNSLYGSTKPWIRIGNWMLSGWILLNKTKFALEPVCCTKMNRHQNKAGHNLSDALERTSRRMRARKQNGPQVCLFSCCFDSEFRMCWLGSINQEEHWNRQNVRLDFDAQFQPESLKHFGAISSHIQYLVECL